MNDLLERFRAAARDEGVGARMRAGTGRALAERNHRVAEEADWEGLRERAREIRARTLRDLDTYLVQLEERVTARGGTVHWARDAAAARRIVVEIARRAGARTVVKSKSMVSEEVGVNEALAAAGIRAVETDLGEFIVQEDGARPIHIVAPAMDRSRESIGKLLAERLGIPYTDDARELARAVRRHLRPVFLSAEMGLSGANFAVAETGTVVVVENEANARLSTTLPGVHVALAGIEKVVPTLADLAVLVHILPRSATGQKITCYVNHFTGASREFHLVLLDNGRTRVLADSRRRELLQCIRCGACMNICPVYQTTGGAPYDWVYPGPIGIALSPLARGPAFAELARASSLCGACTEVCPVKIDLAHHVLAGRAEPRRKVGRVERLAVAVFRVVATHPPLFRLALRAARVASRLAGERVWPSGWTRHRAAPVPATKTFREIWNGELRRER